MTPDDTHRANGHVLLRTARIMVIVAGLIVLGYGVLEGFRHDGDDNGIGATWDCHPIGDGPQSRCRAAYENTGDTHVTALCLAGIGLICTATALGRTDRRAPTVTPVPPTPGHRLTASQSPASVANWQPNHSGARLPPAPPGRYGPGR